MSRRGRLPNRSEGMSERDQDVAQPGLSEPAEATAYVPKSEGQASFRAVQPGG